MNKKNWELYKSSTEGKKIIDSFSFKGANIYDDACEIYKTLDTFNEVTDLGIYASTFQLFAVNLLQSGLLKDEDFSYEDFCSLIDNFQIVDLEESDNGILSVVENPTSKQLFIKNDNYRAKLGCIQYLSMFLYEYYGFFKPILFPRRFDVLEENAEVLDIELPEVPRTKNYAEYFVYYYDLCVAFAKFQEENELTDAEFCACFYGFTSLLKDEDSKKKELPKPTNVWMTGASKEDYKEFLSNIQEDSSSIWACNERTKRGDIVVLYALAPHSCIHSIWRADSGGRFQPFDYYQCRTTVRDGVVIPPISNKELKEHPYFKELPIVRKNLQGVNGIELSATDYNELLKLIEKKGGNIDSLPKLFVPQDWQEIEFEPGHPERNVEEKLLIPVLETLGYTSADWNRQLSQKAGRKEKAIPDFVFFPSGEKHAENAPMVIEAKYDMSSSKERFEAYKQSRSYAKMMSSFIMGICDKERLVIYKRNKNNSFDYSNPIFEAHWATINGDPEVGSTLKKLIGREVIKSLI